MKVWRKLYQFFSELETLNKVEFQNSAKTKRTIYVLKGRIK